MMQLLERFVTALEVIAEAFKSQGGTAPASADAHAQELDRDAIKAELDKFGAVYAPKAKTETLKVMLEKYQTAAKAAAEEKATPEQPPEEPPVEEKPPMATLEAVRDALKSHAIKFGKDSAQAILKDAGQGAVKISEVVPALYPAIIKACNDAGVKEAA